MPNAIVTVLLVLLGLETIALAVVAVLYRKARKASRTRTVEAPNSSYKSQYVEDLEARDRWENMDLDRLHEVNREEVEKLLAKLGATSVRALTSQERAFLERMADAHDRAVQAERNMGEGRTGEEEGRRSRPGPSHAPGTS